MGLYIQLVEDWWWGRFKVYILHIPRKSIWMKLYPLVGSWILWIILKTSRFVWSTGLPRSSFGLQVTVGYGDRVTYWITWQFHEDLSHWILKIPKGFHRFFNQLGFKEVACKKLSVNLKNCLSIKWFSQLGSQNLNSSSSLGFQLDWDAKEIPQKPPARWFKVTKLSHLIGGQQHPLKGSLFHIPKKVTSRIAR